MIQKDELQAVNWVNFTDGHLVVVNNNGRVATLVRQDFSDCQNTTVNTHNPSLNDGAVIVFRGADGKTYVKTVLEKGTPNTKYDFYLKCVKGLGSLTTDAKGKGVADFEFETSIVGPEFAFDMYPGGAPLGNKFQSTTVKFN